MREFNKMGDGKKKYHNDATDDIAFKAIMTQTEYRVSLCPVVFLLLQLNATSMIG